MGCCGSKDVQTKDQNKPADKPPAPPAAKKDEEPAAKKDDVKTEKKDDVKDETKGDDKPGCSDALKTKSEAVEYLVKELGITKENAEKIVASIIDNDDDTLSEEESKNLKVVVDKARDELKPMYLSADTNGTGKVSSSEACSVLGPVFPKMNEKAMRKMLRSFEDGEKYVQFGEFIFFYLFIEKAREELRPVFLAADANDTGTVTLTEAADKLCEHYPNMDERSVKKMLYRCGNGDGTVTYEEFILFFANLKRSKKIVLKKFEALEKDSEGMVKESDVVKLLVEETGMEEDDCKAMVNSSDDSNDARVSAAEFIDTWSKLSAK